MFTPQYNQGIRTYDGGLRQNYPVQQLLDDHPGTDFVAFYLGPERYEPDKKRRVFWDLYSLILEPNDAELVAKYKDRTVIIDTRPIGVLDFELTDVEKDYLLACGRAGAHRMVNKDSPERKAAVAARDALKEKVEAARKKKATTRRRRRILKALLVIAFATGLYFGWDHVTASIAWAKTAIYRVLGIDSPARWSWSQLDPVTADRLVPAISKDNAARAVKSHGGTPPANTCYAYECSHRPGRIALRPAVQSQFRMAISYGDTGDADPMSSSTLQVDPSRNRVILVLFPLDAAAEKIIGTDGPGAIVDPSHSW